jgi:GDPmannose 4,6-dehydratase
MEITWEGSGLSEKAILGSGEVIVCVDERYYRPAEVDILIGDYSKAKAVLGWEPKVKFDELVKLMVENDMKK